MARLGDLITIQRGTTYKSALLGQPGPVLLGLASIARNGGFRSDKLKTYGGESAESLLVRPGQFYASLKDVTQSADLLGSVARLPIGGPIGRLTQDTVRLDIVDNDVSPDFLYWSLMSPEYREYCRAHATGTTNLGLPREDFLAYKIWLPPLDEQQRIAGVLGALDDLIDTNENLMAHLDALGLAVFLRGWDQTTWATVSELGEVTMGQSPPSSSYNEDGEGLPFFQGVRDFGKRFPSERVFCAEPTRRAEAGDILIAVRAPVGDTNVATAETAIGRGLGALHAKRPAIALRALPASAQTWAAHQGTGTVFSSINGKDLRAAKVPLVDSDAVEATLQTFDVQYSACSEEVETLRRTRDELLPLLMSGKIRVLPDASDEQGDQRGAA